MTHSADFIVMKSWRLLLADLGIPAAHVLKLAQLPPDLFLAKEARLSAEDFFAFWNALESLIGPGRLAPELLGRLSVESFDPPVFACLCSPNLNTALHRLARYEQLIAPILLHVAQGAEETSATLVFPGQGRPVPVSFRVYKLLYILKIARLATRYPVKPVHVSVSQLTDEQTEWGEAFGLVLEKGPQDRIVFHAADARRPFLTEDAGMWAFFEPGLNRRLSLLGERNTLAERLKTVLLEMLPAGDATVDMAAGRLAMSKRSLQRKLGDLGLSFQTVLDDTRRELADYYLRQSGFSLPEIAYLLAYEDVTSFQRAYKRWAGMAPAHYRSLHVPG